MAAGPEWAERSHGMNAMFGVKDDKTSKQRAD